MEISKSKEANQKEEKSQNQGEWVAEMITRWLQADSEIEDLTRRAVQKLPYKIEEIAKAVAAEDREKIGTSAHSLKGLAANFNMEEIYELSAKINNIARSDNFNLTKIEKLLGELEEIVANIPQQYLKDDERKDKSLSKTNSKINT